LRLVQVMALPPPMESSSQGFASHIPNTVPAKKPVKGSQEKLQEIVLKTEVSQQRTITTDTSVATGNGRHQHLCEATAELDNIRNDIIRPGSRDQPVICSICTEDVCESQDRRVLPCKHTYHSSCIDPWLLHFGGNCPLW